MVTEDLFDIKIDESCDIEIDSANDISTISGFENLQQSVRISAKGAIDQFVGGKVSGSTVALLEERLKNALNNDPQVGEITNVTLLEYDKRDSSIEAEATVTENENFTIEVTS